MPKNSYHESNEEFMIRIMNFSRNGALMQALIIDALTQHSQRVIDNEEQLLKDMKDSFISGEAWVATAKELKEEMDKKYGK